jgi:hypothetical protein
MLKIPSFFGTKKYPATRREAVRQGIVETILIGLRCSRARARA